MSGVFTKRLPRKYSVTGGVVSSVRYSRSSDALFFQVKYVYDIVKPSFARLFMRFGRVNASEKKITSGCTDWISAISHSQNGSGFVWGLSTRKIFTPWATQCSTTSRHASHRLRRSAHQ